MPELVDVEGWKRYANRYVRGSTVDAVHVPEPSVLHGTSPQGLGNALRGRRLGDHRRRGKWLIGQTSGPTLVFHFGMTGELSYSKSRGDLHDHDRVVFDLDDGRLTYRSQRILGSVTLVPQGGDPADVTGPLGPDADAVADAEFADLLSGRRGRIKSALMDQELLAGIGNELSDEILWRARVHPEREVSSLDDGAINDLYDAMVDVLRQAKRHGRIPRRGGWLESVRGEPEPRCPRCRGRIETIPSAGRTAYVCPKEQA